MSDEKLSKRSKAIAKAAAETKNYGSTPRQDSTNGAELSDLKHSQRTQIERAPLLAAGRNRSDDVILEVKDEEPGEPLATGYNPEEGLIDIHQIIQGYEGCDDKQVAAAIARNPSLVQQTSRQRRTEILATAHHIVSRLVKEELPEVTQAQVEAMNSAYDRIFDNLWRKAQKAAIGITTLGTLAFEATYIYLIKEESEKNDSIENKAGICSLLVCFMLLTPPTVISNIRQNTILNPLRYLTPLIASTIGFFSRPCIRAELRQVVEDQDFVSHLDEARNRQLRPAPNNDCVIL